MKALRFIAWIICRVISLTLWFPIVFPMTYLIYLIDPLYHRVIIDSLMEGYRKSDHEIMINGRLHSVDKEVGELIITISKERDNLRNRRTK